MTERILLWLIERRGIGLGFAFGVTVALTFVIHSLWLLLVWLVTALGAAFDEGWNSRHNDLRRERSHD